MGYNLGRENQFAFYTNNLRIQYTEGSDSFQKEHQNVEKLIKQIEQDFEAELQLPRLHHEQKKVLNSMKKHWEGLTVFANHPYIPMDNNTSERTLRNPVVGRKNYYGSGAIWSAHFTAMMLSIFQTLELWEINQYQWLSGYLNACAEAGRKAPADITPYLPWYIKEKEKPGQIYCGRTFSADEINNIRTLIEEDTSRNRTLISKMACELLNWRKPDGSLKERSMRIALLKMEKDAHLTLPPSKQTRKIVQKPIQHTDKTAPKEEIFGSVGSLPELSISIAQTKDDKLLWNEYIDRYHYLGYKTIPGATLKYFIYAGDELVALIGFGASAWRIEPRDKLIGWNNKTRTRNLHFIVNNNRFLILPWVLSKNLASKILSLVLKRISNDWEYYYKYKPVLLETFVEEKRFTGACYLASNWQYIGKTKGCGKKNRYGKAGIPKKKIFIYNLKKNFNSLLC